MLLITLCCALLGAEADAPAPYWGIQAVPMDSKVQAIYAKQSGKPCPIKIGVSAAVVDADGPAAKAGVRACDVIVAIDKKAIKELGDLMAIFEHSKPGQEVTLDIRHMQPKDPAGTNPPANRRGGGAVQPMIWSRIECKLTVEDKAVKQAAAAAEAVAEEKAGPLKIVAALITHNSIGEPVLAVRTVAKKDIEAYEIEANAFDKFDDPIKNWGFAGNNHTAMSQRSMKKGADKTELWTMHGADGVGVFKCKLLRVKLADGGVWKPDPDAPIVFQAKLERN